MASEVRRGAIRILSNYARLLATLVIGVAEVPLLLYWLGKEPFGLVNLLGPTIGLAGILFELVNQSMIRELGAARHSGDPDRFRAVYHTCWRVSAIAAAAALVLFLVLALVVVPVLDIGDHLLVAAIVFTLASGAFAFVRILVTPAMSMYVVDERFQWQNFWIFASRAIYLAAAIVLLIVLGRDNPPRSVLWYGIAVNGGSILLTVAGMVHVLRGDTSLRPGMRHASRDARQEILGTVGWNSLVIVGLNLADRLPALLVNLFFGLSGNAIYGVAMRLAAYARMATVGATYGLEAVATRISSQTDSGGAIASLVRHTTRVHAGVALPAAVSLLLLMHPVITLWVGRGRDLSPEEISLTATVGAIMAVAMAIRGVGEGWMRVAYGAGHVRAYAPLIFVSSVAVPLITWLMLELMTGEESFSIPALLYLAFCVLSFVVFVPAVVVRTMRVRLSTLWLPLVRPAVAVALASSTLVAADVLIDTWSIPLLLASGIAFGLAYAVGAGLLVLTPLERSRAISIVRGRRKPAPPPTPGPTPPNIDDTLSV